MTDLELAQFTAAWLDELGGKERMLKTVHGELIYEDEKHFQLWSSHQRDGAVVAVDKYGREYVRVERR